MEMTRNASVWDAWGHYFSSLYAVFCIDLVRLCSPGSLEILAVTELTEPSSFALPEITPLSFPPTRTLLRVDLRLYSSAKVPRPTLVSLFHAQESGRDYQQADDETDFSKALFGSESIQVTSKVMISTKELCGRSGQD